MANLFNEPWLLFLFPISRYFALLVSTLNWIAAFWVEMPELVTRMCMCVCLYTWMETSEPNSMANGGCVV